MIIFYYACIVFEINIYLKDRINFNMKRLFIVLSILYFQNTFGQKDTIKKNCISINLFQIAVNGEAGLYFDRNIGKDLGFEFSYGHRFWNFNIIKGGGPNTTPYFPQTADIIRIGIKRFINDKKLYYSVRLGYENTHTPKYWERQGSGGLNSTWIKYISVDKNLFNFSTGMGKEYYYKEHLFINVFFAGGFCIGKKATHYFGDGQHGYFPETATYNKDEHYYNDAFFPTIEIGIKIGLRV
jgi:hypothetical protein